MTTNEKTNIEILYQKQCKAEPIFQLAGGVIRREIRREIRGWFRDGSEWSRSLEHAVALRDTEAGGRATNKYTS